PDVRLAGIHSRSLGRAQALSAEFRIPIVATGIAELYERTQADLVVIAVPELEVRAVAEACFQFPWTALVEKPAGYNYEDAQMITQAADARGRRAFVALNRRFYSSTRQVERGLIADPSAQRFIKVQDQEDPEQARLGGQPALVVANWMYANSIHLIDFFRIFGRGAITSVAPIRRWNPERPGVVVSHIRFESGDEGLYEGIWNAPAPWIVSVSTPQTRWELRPIEQASRQDRGERRAVPIEAEACDTEYKAGLQMQARAAIAAARQESTDLPTLADALETMRLTRMIFA
ncbi:MAG: Gfo/Idh/MocA family oxidoreductase, partial [Gemmatimonadaceae bacterium]|nr:Gfo/Idh/MocA family oxidoreductase [Gemmatimonadaceae bacterium]